MSSDAIEVGHDLTPMNLGPMTVDEADDLDRRIHQAIEDTWVLLVEMSDRHGWEALGYGSMASYLMEGLDVKSSQAYRLLDRVSAVKAIAAAVGDNSPEAQAAIAKTVSTKAAAEIKPVLSEVAGQVAGAVQDGTSLEDATADVVAASRADRKAKKAEAAADPETTDDTRDAAVLSGEHPAVPFDDSLLAGLGPGELAALGLDPNSADTGDNDRAAAPARSTGYDDEKLPNLDGRPIGGGRVQYQETPEEIVTSGDGLAAAHAAADAANASRQSIPWESGYDDGHDGGEDFSRMMSEAPGHEKTGAMRGGPQRQAVQRPLPPRPGRKTCPTCAGNADIVDTDTNIDR